MSPYGAAAPKWAEDALKAQIAARNAVALKKMQENKPITPTEAAHLVHDTNSVIAHPDVSQDTKKKAAELQQTTVQALPEEERHFIAPIVTVPPESKCFIATAAYGSPLEPQVEAARHFRDEALEPSRLGHIMVRTYYGVSPPIARGIARSNPLRSMVRTLISPIIRHFGR